MCVVVVVVCVCCGGRRHYPRYAVLRAPCGTGAVEGTVEVISRDTQGALHAPCGVLNSLNPGAPVALDLGLI